ncbi:hypothetical protein OIU84_022511 [Salix udensis]|uniref:Uncharacterized protein n=1 Tax=Salix udensis TaxID=889485 RepID=A0AAD6PEK5_9ROSI|nr:hypothetical protein OIU84_022511 [Salix udensis]
MMIMEAVLLVVVVCVLILKKWLELGSETLGSDSESSKQVSGFAIEDMGFLESKAFFQNPNSTSSSALLHVDVGLLFGGLI